jgi:hypothetical protein
MATRTRAPKSSPSPARRAAAAKKAADVLAAHRRDIADARALCRKLVAELSFAAAEAETIDLSAEVQPKADKRRQTAMMRAVSLAGRAAVMRDLASASRTLIELERRAFDLSAADESEEARAHPSAIDSIAAGMARLAASAPPSDES